MRRGAVPSPRSRDPHICHCRMCQKATGNPLRLACGRRAHAISPGRAGSRPISAARTWPRAASAGLRNAAYFRFLDGGPVNRSRSAPRPAQRIPAGLAVWRWRSALPSLGDWPGCRAPLREVMPRPPPASRKIQPAPRSRHGSDCRQHRVRPMSKDRLYLFDTTLRDGAQTAGIELSARGQDPSLPRMLDELGVDYVEGGYPGANPHRRPRSSPRGATRDVRRFTAFGMTKRSGRSVGNDPGLQAILTGCGGRRSASSGRPRTFRSSSPWASSQEENLRRSPRSIEAIVAAGRKRLSIASTSSTATRTIRTMPCASSRTAYRGRRPLGRALRHQWRHAAA